MKINFLSKYTKKLLFIILITFLLFSANIALAAEERALEIKYPDVPQAISTPSTNRTPIPEYVQYLYYFFIGAGIVVALVVLVNAGVQYITSVGNPGQMQDAKERIISTLIALLLLVGSGVILATIYPGFVILDIKEISPTISSIPTGVILCKGPADLNTAWRLSREFYMTNPSDDRKKQIREQIEPLIKDIRKNCYPITTGTDVKDDFDNKATSIWFLPNWWYDYEKQAWLSEEYGAVTYEETGFKGKSIAHIEHLKGVTAADMRPYEVGISGVSSVAPFRLIYETDPNWFITVYNNFNYNDGIREEDKKSTTFDLPFLWWREVAKSGSGGAGYFWGDWFPKSMKTEGSLLTVLYANEGKSESFFSNNVANLEAYDNIIEWEDCENYEGEREQGWVFKDCAHSKVSKIFIIAAERL